MITIYAFYYLLSAASRSLRSPGIFLLESEPADENASMLIIETPLFLENPEMWLPPEI